MLSHESVHRWVRTNTYLIVARYSDLDPPPEGPAYGVEELMYRLATHSCSRWNRVAPMNLETEEPLTSLDEYMSGLPEKLQGLLKGGQH